MLEVIDSVTSMCQVENFNIILDEKLNKLKLFSCGTWKTQLIDSGIKELIEKVQSCYLDAYECYLIRKVIGHNGESLFEQQHAREHLEQYYRFIGSFEIVPYVIDKTDNQILFNIDDERYHEKDEGKDHILQEKWYSKYKTIKVAMPQHDKNKIIKSVKDIIKRNSRSNVVELNKLMMEIFQMDESFKEKVIGEITLSISSNES